MDLADSGTKMQNDVRTGSDSGTELTHWRSPGVRYKTGPGFVYFIRAGDAIKIGFALNVTARLAQLQTCNPRELELLGALPASEQSEAQLHAMFCRLHIRGEWFREHPAILEYVTSNTRQRWQLRKHGSAKLAQLEPMPTILCLAASQPGAASRRTR